MKFLVICVLVGVVFVEKSSAIKCYQCVFPGDGKCETASGLTAELCSEPTTIEVGTGIKAVCLKSVTNLGGGAKQITRSCSRQGLGVDACSVFKDHLEHCSVCDTDLCNGSSFIKHSIWSTLLPVVLAVFFKMF